MKTLLLLLMSLACAGCHNLHFTQTKPDGTRVDFTANSLFSNTMVKGLTVDGTTKTTSKGLGITSGSTEPNVESITASGAALGELIGTAAKASIKP